LLKPNGELNAQRRGGLPSFDNRQREDGVAYKKIMRFNGAQLVVACAVFMASASVASAQQSVEQFYKGKTVSILIGHPPGGSYDTYARLAVAHLGKYIPGHPVVQLQARPGSGGVPAVAWFYANAPRDGTMIGLLPDSIAMMQILQPDIGKWRVQEFSYLGSFVNVNEALVLRKSAAVKPVADMRGVPFTLGCSGKLSNAYMSPTLLNAYGGYKFKVVCGYPGSSDIVLAMARGEVDGYMGTWNQWSTRSEIRDGSFVPVLQSGLKRHHEIPNVPLMQDLFDDPQKKEIMAFKSGVSAIGRALLAPAAVPADRIAALRNAFDQVVRDPDFLKEAAARDAEIDPTSGAEIQTVSEGIVNAKPEIVKMAVEGMQ
jgi:tripartite-type tricarboxylate transporter receptor subunit TctC